VVPSDKRTRAVVSAGGAPRMLGESARLGGCPVVLK